MSDAPMTDESAMKFFDERKASFILNEMKRMETELTAARKELAKYKSIAETAISDHELSEIRNHKLESRVSELEENLDAAISQQNEIGEARADNATPQPRKTL